MSSLSPCVGDCRLDPQQRCLGCLRTIDEIADWPYLSTSERRQILQKLAHRREQPGDDCSG
ncbi:DUF1289 domain-containing protein [Ferrimonas pelagia]|uniref:DUF1289 domain-containing protein n=1 Tax=Ferrimonas pelagia TaxID=1177826 RepID=A0ABP9EWL0_9GAMM